MAIKEARCKNCGSIIRVDDKAERAICVFCGAKTPTAEALKIQENPDDYTFLNEKQEELTEAEYKEALAGHRGAGGKFKAPVVPSGQAARPAKPTPADRVAQLESKPIEIKKLSRRIVLAVTLGIVLFVGIIMALILPPFFKREHTRKLLQEKMEGIMPAAVAADDKRYMIDGQDNRHLRVISPEEVTQEEAVDLAEKFLQARADVYGLPADTPQPKVRVDLISEQKSFRVFAGEVKEVAGINPDSIVKEKAEKKADKAEKEGTKTPAAGTGK